MRRKSSSHFAFLNHAEQHVMSLRQYAGRLYSLDTLDPRFTTSTKSPPPPIDPARSSPDDVGYRKGGGGVEETDKRASPPRWKSPEFIYHGLMFVVNVPLMFKTVYDVSKSTHPQYHKFAHALSAGWIPGRLVDNSDQQYAGFRENLPYLSVIMALHPLLRRLFDAVFRRSASSRGPSSENFAVVPGHIKADHRLNQRVAFDVAFGLVFLLTLHGFSALKILLILYINYSLATRLKKEYVPTATWVFNIGILFANELGKGYPFATIVNVTLPQFGNSEVSTKKGNWGAVLDSYGGLDPRWEVLFNIKVLRLISFNLDYCWSLNKAGGSPIEKKQLDPANLSERDRVDISAKAEDYSFRNYLAYVLYSPLYLAGPILTFNDFVSQQRYTPRSITRSRTLLYGLRFLISLLFMEIMIHYIYVIAISKSQPAWEVYTPFQLSMLGYFSVHHIWLKLLLPWRFFRLWSLLDGIDPPENMVRCTSNVYSTLAFWRGWHRSFNRWIVRYIYIPLGGSGGPGTRGPLGQMRGVCNLLVVFTFVAIWHDIQLRLLVWGWLISLFVLPETVATLLFPRNNWKNHPETYRMLCGVGAVGNLLMMMSANLVGFAVGLDGLKGMVQGIIGTNSGLFFLACACATVFTAIQVMFELREQEVRQGITMKC